MRGRPLLMVLLAAALLVTGCTRLKKCAYEGFGRDKWQKPDEVVALLDLRRGEVVADLGAGGGYFTFRFASAVGPEGIVYAIDVDGGMLDAIRDEAIGRGLANVRTVLASPDDPGLAAASVDLVFLANTFHHLPERPAYFRRLAAALRPGGTVVIVEYEPRGFVAGWLGHSVESEEIAREMAEAGYVLVRRHDVLERQSFQVFAAEGAR